MYTDCSGIVVVMMVVVGQHPDYYPIIVAWLANNTIYSEKYKIIFFLFICLP